MNQEFKAKQYNFELSLSVLNHLGRNLYRNFVTVLGEAISNSWDADAKNVWINIDKESSSFSIKDDGVGMSGEDFQGKFLKIGYSKRRDGKRLSDGKRPYIGAKGIGKLALLSCADRISIFTKTAETDYVGGAIDNDDLDQAITDDLTPQQYELEQLDVGLAEDLMKDHQQGTIIIFQNMKEQMKNSEAYIKKILAMSFKFSLLDPAFTIHVNGEPVSIEDLSDLSGNTEFIWLINKYEDAYTSGMKKLKAEPNGVVTDLPIKGFMATVVKPRDAKISMTEERASVDLFVNGRLREKNILRHIPTQRIVESYLYGQIHYDSMDREGTDPFTSSREGIVEDDGAFNELLEYLKKDLIPKILDEWDELRLSRNEEGDDENKRVSKKQRKAKALVSEVEKEFSPPSGSPQKDAVESWLVKLRPDAEFNISAYVDCFLSENLIRQFIDNQSIAMTKPAQGEIAKWKKREEENLEEANISYDITRSTGDLGYLGMKELSILSEGGKTDTKGKHTPLYRDQITYTPIRNAVGHTSLLTPNAKTQLGMTLENIKARLRKMLEKVKTTP
ncbi:ATP-binding protein [Phaeobacter inhibens]|uniref:ATP-binding protein n=1 Tax=Phaeobacter inhibens TaxID=221822 RepID=UPI0021A278E8|nr:ATP-binding protein [Phaeobacter inhibens]UWR51467.1 ATP-binding protein [Phaeobacter inhibens]